MRLLAVECQALSSKVFSALQKLRIVLVNEAGGDPMQPSGIIHDFSARRIRLTFVSRYIF